MEVLLRSIHQYSAETTTLDHPDHQTVHNLCPPEAYLLPGFPEIKFPK